VRHHALNECISRTFSAAGIPVKKEPAGLVQSDGKRPDGCILIPWRGTTLSWDVTVCTTVAASYMTAASHTAARSLNKLPTGNVQSTLNCLPLMSFSQGS